MKSRIIPVVLTAAVTSLSTFYIAGKLAPMSWKTPDATVQTPVNYAHFSPASTPLPPANFESAAEASVKAVVHIKTQIKGKAVAYEDPFFGNLFGPRYQYIPQQTGSGSGVVISPEGFIITNNHVVANTDKVTVTFNDRYTAEARVVGKDPSTDLAVLKVEEKSLPYMEFGNSDDVKLGQWVLAVGYPLTLDATVTAGIVSAKSRAIGINATQASNAIESFIQTDAAVNPGNSGGALVNATGQLIGINSAIASPTGSYAGYSYAIPANIVRKVSNDLIKYGAVQRAYMGIEYLDSKRLTPEQLSELSIDKTEGVFVAGVPENGGAFAAGIRKGDFITSINGVATRTEPQLQEQIARYKPGDNITVTYLRNGKAVTTTVQLKNALGTTAPVKKGQLNLAMMGATMRNLTEDEKNKYNVDGGVVVSKVGNGLLAQQRMRDGFVITGANDESIGSVDELQQLLAGGRRVQLSGFYPGVRGIYYYGVSTNNDE